MGEQALQVYRLETGNDRPLKPADVALIYDKVQLLDVWEETCRWWISVDEKKKRYNPMNIEGLVERYQQNVHSSSVVVDDLPLYRLPIGEKRTELIEAFRRAQRPIDKRMLVQEARELLEQIEKEEEERGNVTHSDSPGKKGPAASWHAAMELEKVLQSNTSKSFQGVVLERRYQQMVKELERRGIPRPDGQEGHGATNGTAEDGIRTKGDRNGGIDG